MADYFTNFSLIIPLPNEAAEKYAFDLAGLASRIRLGDEQMPDNYPSSLRAAVDDWQFDTDAACLSKGCGLWLHSSSGGVDAVCTFIQHLLGLYDPYGYITLEWSHDCSKPRTDAYGGGAAVITADKIKTITTGVWLHRQVKRLHAPKPSTNRKDHHHG